MSRQLTEKQGKTLLILFQRTKEGFVDEGQLLRVSVMKALPIGSESIRMAETNGRI